MIRCIHSRILLTECASESLYSVQNIANIRIRLIFDSSNTLVYRLSPTLHSINRLSAITSSVAKELFADGFPSKWAPLRKTDSG